TSSTVHPLPTSSSLAPSSARQPSEGSEEDEQPIKLIRIRSTSRHARRGSKGRTVEIHSEEPDGFGEEFSEMLPFALVSPENWGAGEEGGERKFLREFRYGALDVLNPEHSDFVPMSTAIFGPHMRVRS
ncbi:hypothetical protein P7C70_g8007, partial [Phenoliferia sp. Uapishka_3]